MPRQRLYDKYRTKMTKVADIGHATAVLHWDKETYLPENATQHRSQQIATLSGIAHQEFVDKDFGAMLDRLLAMKSLTRKERRNVEITKEQYDKSTQFSEAFVIRKSQVVSTAFNAWMQARKEKNWDVFAGPFADLVAIKREEATKLKKGEHLYDALLDQYEPNLTVAQLDEVFAGVKTDLTKLIKKISKRTQVKNKFLYKTYPLEDQWDFGLGILANMGYDFSRGRQDVSTHPFTTSFSPNDVRVTTRVDENDFGNMTWSCIHEGGHALYEQGLPVQEYGLPSGSYISLAIHESQSRLWENHVGRSLDYWKYAYPIAQSYFPKSLKKVSLYDFYRGINKIKPNAIRTEADELHYHFHVLIRYEIEKDLLAGTIEAADVKEVWNQKYAEYLGIHPLNDNEGVLQDVHWAHGSIGYFPTYSLGSFYAAQFYQQAEKDIKNLGKKLSKGKTAPLLSWLRENIHQHGRSFEANEICKRVTGQELEVGYFVDYAKKKFKGIYQ